MSPARSHAPTRGTSSRREGQRETATGHRSHTQTQEYTANDHTQERVPPLII